MSTIPLITAFIVTLIGAIPAYFLAISGLQLSLADLPWILLAFFVTGALSAWLTARLQATQAGTPRKVKASSRNSESSARGHSQRESGSVKWFNASKGFGFITRDSGDDVFVHFRSIRGEGHRILRDGQRVEFAVSEGDKGLQADDVAPAR